MTLSMVNKRMRDLSRDDTLWTELTLDYEDILQSEGSCRGLVERCKKLASLKITHKENFFSSVNSNIMPVVIGAKNCLNSLDVDWSLNYWTDAAMCELSKMKGLRNLSFAFNSDQNPKRLSNLAQLDQLEILKINYKGIGEKETLLKQLRNFDRAMKNVFQQLKKLKIVDFPFPSDDMLVALASTNPGLKVLRIRGGFYSVKSIEVLSNKCPDLEELQIDYLRINSEEEIEKFCFPKLKHLDISCFYTSYMRLLARRLSIEETLTKLIEKHECLQSFNLRGFSSVAPTRAHGFSIFAETESLIQGYRRKYSEINFTIED